MFEDNFDTLNKNTWRVLNDCSTGNNCVYNNELQVYLASQVYVTNGSLVIEATNESYISCCWHAAVSQYGRFEARIKLPVGQGMWPAFWLMPRTSACWPTAGEIDIMEYTGDFPNTLNGPPCSQRRRTLMPIRQLPLWSIVQQPPHVGGLWHDGHGGHVEWTPTFISWLYDGSVYYILSSAQWAPSAFFFIPKDPFYFILNLAVGGDWPGSPNATTVFPQRMYVDYVRAYKRT
ncbi:hypothetical protein SDRG_04390 [Saprolegnia diclina VS20]|uniref:GH16 domain-containing protein n=1 Tax=Saprolegnia diclina (strain VS20) TaxID=1156394 RepID=T0QXB1_SAPDV|nr:hypothetical protein SDRG_04390 [Saprolegnia diclina VS20]EQC38695.1 hypothetical protein SDRG_04390 [Saprolegnia diclina VS20]|eukprot:XP_008608287.1 hypothetical protein SDRG_04390 [Saprolegnia diclina VS20]